MLFPLHLQSWTKPLSSPHKQCWTRVSRIFSEIQLCIGWGEGELQEKFENDAVLRGSREMTENMHIAVLSQGLLSRIVARKICLPCVPCTYVSLYFSMSFCYRSRRAFFQIWLNGSYFLWRISRGISPSQKERKV